MVRREETSPKGDGSIRRYFCGEAAAAEKEAAVAAAADDGVAAAEVGADNGAHRLRFGDAGLSSGSKSRVRFRVAPHAMAGAPGSGGVRKGGQRKRVKAEPRREPNRRAQEWKAGWRSAGEGSRAAAACPCCSPRLLLGVSGVAVWMSPVATPAKLFLSVFPKMIHPVAQGTRPLFLVSKDFTTF